jgi:chitin synthase
MVNVHFCTIFLTLYFIFFTYILATFTLGGTLQKGDSNCIPFRTLRQFYKSKRALVYDWSDLQPNGTTINAANPVNLTVLGDGSKIAFDKKKIITRTTSKNTAYSFILLLHITVLNLSYYVSSGQKFFGNRADVVIRQARGQDASYMFSSWDEVKQAEACLNARYYSGVISSDTMGCIISQVITSLMFAIIIGLIVVRFSMAALFHWFVAPKLVKPGGRSGKILAWRSVAGGNNDPAIRRPPPAIAPEAEPDTPPPASVPVKVDRSFSTSSENTTMFDTGSVDTQLYTLMLVTCYSEGEASMRRALDSLARTTYSNRHKVSGIMEGMAFHKVLH